MGDATPSLALSLIVGVGVSTAVLLVGSLVAMWAVTGKVIDGLAVGAFTAVWGGPGFGVMFGGAAYSLNVERRTAATAPVGGVADPIPLPPVGGFVRAAQREAAMPNHVG